MKSILLISIVLLSVIASPEDCVKEKCPKEYNNCTKAVFGCASKALKCSNKCGTESACLEKCCYDSKDAKLIALYECGKANCSAASEFWSLAVDNCDLEQCATTFTKECFNLENSSIQCALGFFNSHPECECVRNM